MSPKKKNNRKQNRPQDPIPQGVEGNVPLPNAPIEPPPAAAPEPPPPAAQPVPAAAPNPAVPGQLPPVGVPGSDLANLVALSGAYKPLRPILVGVGLLLFVFVGRAGFLSLDQILAICILGVPLLYIFMVYAAEADLVVDQLTPQEQEKKKQRYSWFGGYIVLLYLFVLTAIVTSVFLAVPRDLTAWLPTPEAPRIPYPNDIPVVAHLSSEPGDGLLPKPVSGNSSDKDKLEHKFKKWQDWIYQGIKPTDFDHQVLVIRSTVDAFTKRYNTISAKVSFANDATVHLMEGCAFMVKPLDIANPQINYRQVNLDIPKDNPDNSNTLQIPNPDPGESLLIILKVQARKDAKLPDKASAFGVSVNKR